ncbi:MAG: PilC/PilY family type IV pilus protein, partial [Burkholderiaceae bacterium]
NSTQNPAFWQHMVTYGIGLGVNGSVNPSTAFNAITASPSPTITWPDPSSSNPAKIDDLLHAAVNSRGGFFSAADPDTFATELTNVLRSIVARVTAAGTAAAASSALLQSDSKLYNATFRSSDWSGTLVARDLDPDTGEPETGLAWDAEQLLGTRDPASRRIFTSTEAGTAVVFDYANLGSAQQSALAVNPAGAPASSATGVDRVNWLRGVEHAQLRNRTVDGFIRRMGDIIGSDPQFLSKRDFGYSLLSGSEGSSYRTFRSSASYRNRTDALLVGSNDGLFHAFDADNGNELFAYVPSELLLPSGSNSHAQINELMRTDYDHRYFVDGAAAISDVYIGGSWRTVVVGTMGAGGRTVFALDVTDPDSFSSSRVLWEFKWSDTACSANPNGTSGSQSCRGIGYGVTKPRIVRLASGRWAAVFGNGYNSNNHRARLMAVDMATGRLLYNITMPDGASASLPNGMSPAETTDWPANDLSLANTYSGDLLGNVWRVNFRTASPTVTLLHSAVDGAGQRQPITARPRVALKPESSSDVVVLFGTGSFFRVGDDSTVSPQVQTLYGIFDSAGTPVTGVLRSELGSQVITATTSDVTINGTTYAAGSLRYVTDNALADDAKGWRIDLPVSGERVINEATFPTGALQRRVRFSTLIPDDDPCGSGRQGFLMDIGLLSGGRFEAPVFDLSGDGAYDNNDIPGGSGNPPSGIGGPTGETMVPVRKPDSNSEGLYKGDGTKLVDGSNESGPAGRQSWRQLR